jgi:hypothetical protein
VKHQATWEVSIDTKSKGNNSHHWMTSFKSMVDEANNVEFEVESIVSAADNGRVLIRFKGYTEHFDMYVDPNNKFQYPGFESAFDTFRLKQKKEICADSKMEQILSSAGDLEFDLEIMSDEQEEEGEPSKRQRESSHFQIDKDEDEVDEGSENPLSKPIKKKGTSCQKR